MEQMKSNKLVIIGFISAGIIIFILLGMVIFRKPIDGYIPFDKTPYTKKIKELEVENSQLHKDNDKIDKDNTRWKASFDSLEALKPKIKIIYEPQKAFIPNSTDSQLDSIIRSNIRTN